MGLLDALFGRQQTMTPPIASDPSDPMAGILAQGLQQQVQPSLAQKLQLAGAQIQDIGQLDGGGRGAAVQSQIDAGQKQATSMAQRIADMNAASQLFPGTDRQSQTARLLFASGNPDFRKALASHFETRTVEGGSTIADPLFGGDRVAAKLNDNNGSMTTQTVDGVTQTGQAAPSYSDKTGRINAVYRTVAPGGSIVPLPDPDSPAQSSAAPPGGLAAAAQLPAGATSAGVPTLGVAPPIADYKTIVRQIESSGNDSAQNGSSTGRYQFQPKTFAAVGGTNINDPSQQEAAMDALTAQNHAGLSQALGREPTQAELYLAHQQGLHGALSLLSNPNAPATSVRPANAITGNGGSPGMTAGDFTGMWARRFAGAAGGQPAPQAQAPQAAPAAAPGQLRAIYTAPEAPKPRTTTLTPAEVAAAGLQPGTVAQRGDNGAISVVQAPVKAPDVKISPRASMAADAAVTQAQKLRQIADLSKRYLDLNMQESTGPALGIPGVGALANAFSPARQEMNAIQQKLIPMAREAGQGPIRMGEISGPSGGIFGGQAVRQNNSGEANRALAVAAEKQAQEAEAQADFVSNYVQQKGTEIGWYPAYLKQKGNARLKATSAATAAASDPLGLLK